MAKLPEVFDTSAVEDDDFSPLTAGSYICRVTGSEYKDTKAGTGTYFKLELTVIGGEFNSRKLWTNINWTNPNQTAVDIGKKMMKQLCIAVGKPNGIEDTQELHGIPVSCKVAIKGDDTSPFGPQNIVKKFSKAEESSVPDDDDPF